MADDTTHKAGAVKTFSCPNCGGTISIRAVGVSITAVCQSCGSIIDVANEELSIISKAHAHTKSTLDLPIGSRGQLFGAEWEVIGYTERGDLGDEYSWSEYLLFNPWQGFRFLVESDNHWTFVKMLRMDIDYPEYEGRKYRLFARANIKVRYVLGEFYWRTKIDDKCSVEDFVAPPYILSREDSGQDVIWSHGIYVKPEIIRTAFGIKENWPSPIGIAPNQPNPAGQSMGKSMLVAAVAILCLIVFQIIVSGASKKEVLIDTAMQVYPAQKDTPQSTDEFVIPGNIGNVEIQITSPVDNDWVEVEAELVNQDNQENDQTLETVEYYHGYDSDGAWSEGGQSRSDILSAVPGGRYRLLLQADAGAFAHNAPAFYTLRVVRDVPAWSNFWTAFLLLLAAPCMLMFYQSNYETRRWAQCEISGLSSMNDMRKHPS